MISEIDHFFNIRRGCLHRKRALDEHQIFRVSRRILDDRWALSRCHQHQFYHFVRGRTTDGLFQVGISDWRRIELSGRGYRLMRNHLIQRHPRLSQQRFPFSSQSEYIYRAGHPLQCNIHLQGAERAKRAEPHPILRMSVTRNVQYKYLMSYPSVGNAKKGDHS